MSEDSQSSVSPLTLEKHAGGRPRELDRVALMAAVCERVSRGELVKYAAEAEGTTAESIRCWAAETPEFASRYASARAQQAHAMAEQAIEIADGSDALTALYGQAIEDEDESLAANPARRQIINALRAGLVNRDRMRVDARKWLTSKIAPKLYGERLEISTVDNRDLAQLSDDELKAERKKLKLA